MLLYLYKYICELCARCSITKEWSWASWLFRSLLAHLSQPKGTWPAHFFLQEDIAVKSDMTWLTWQTPDESWMDIYGYGTISGVGYTGTCFVRFEVGYLFIVSEGVAVDRSFSAARLEETQINNMTWHQDDTATCQLARNQVKVQPCCKMLPKVTTCYHPNMLATKSKTSNGMEKSKMSMVCA